MESQGAGIGGPLDVPCGFHTHDLLTGRWDPWRKQQSCDFSAEAPALPRVRQGPQSHAHPEDHPPPHHGSTAMPIRKTTHLPTMGSQPCPSGKTNHLPTGTVCIAVSLSGNGVQIWVSGGSASQYSMSFPETLLSSTSLASPIDQALVPSLLLLSDLITGVRADRQTDRQRCMRSHTHVPQPLQPCGRKSLSASAKASRVLCLPRESH